MSDNYRLNYRGLQTYDRLLKQYINDKLPVEFVGATRLTDGKSGLVPAPMVGDQTRYLKGDGTWSDIPSFITVYDVNEEQITIEQENIEISSIECFLAKKVDLEGHFLMSLYSTENCYLYIRIYDDNIPEVFTPQPYILNVGYNEISIPHAYIGKNSGLHLFTVNAQCSNGKLTVPTRSLLYTIFGSINDDYQNLEVDIVDIAIKEDNGIPSEIWSLGFDEGELFLRNNIYNNPNGNKWNDVHDFGIVYGGCLEFYGSWFTTDQSSYHLNTEDYPFVFIIDGERNLYAYSNNDYENGELLATNVTQVSSVIGYKSNIIASKDQGLIVAYLKNGNVYYRQWKYYDEESNMWYSSEEVYTGGDAYDVSIHRLPDYRIGILIKATNGDQWFISDRTYIGNTAKKEISNINIDGNYTLIGIVPVSRASESLGVATINTFEEAHYHNGFIMTFEGELKFLFNENLESFKNNITMKRGNTTIAVGSVEIIDNQIIVYAANDVQGGSTATISWTTSNLITTNVNGSAMLIRQKSYTWNLPTTHVSASISDLGNIVTMGGTPIVNIGQIKTKKYKIKDANAVSMAGQHGVSISQIMTDKCLISDSENITTSAELNTTVSQVGETPI